MTTLQLDYLYITLVDFFWHMKQCKIAPNSELEQLNLQEQNREQLADYVGLNPCRVISYNL
jgi:hypothetical protein